MITIGANAGPANPTASDGMQLYIDVEETDNPLIYGDFNKNELTIYGKQLEISDDMSTTLRFDRSGTSNGTQRFDFEIAMDGGDMIFQGGRNGSGDDLDTIMRLKANGNITGKVVEVSDDDSPLLRFDRSGARFDFEITMDGPDMLFQGGRNGTGAALDTLVRIDDNGNITASGAINGSSVIHRKESIVPIDSKSVLDKVANLPITKWQYKGSFDRHIGPMAQDFYAAFGLGQGETTIATVDADGVALAAIQALNEKLETKVLQLEKALENQQQEKLQLEKRLSRIEALLLRE